MAQEVIINIGVSGAGKSTWTRSELRHRENTIRINRDSIRESLFGSLDGYYEHKNLTKREGYVTRVEDMFFMDALKRGYDIIVDNTNLKEEYIKRWISYVDGWNDLRGTNIEVFFKIFPEDNAEILKKRVDIRDSPLGWDKLDYIDKQIKSLKSAIAYVEKNHKKQII